MWRLLPIILLVSCAVNETRETATDGQTPGNYRIVSILDVPLNPPSKPDAEASLAKAFQHGEARGRVEETGTWNITRPVTHNRLRCATYETGIQLGEGNPACSHVRWLTNIEYGTRQTHCNSATRIHTGGGKFADINSTFGALTCVRVVTRCTGPC